MGVEIISKWITFCCDWDKRISQLVSLGYNWWRVVTCCLRTGRTVEQSNSFQSFNGHRLSTAAYKLLIVWNYSNIREMWQIYTDCLYDTRLCTVGKVSGSNYFLCFLKGTVSFFLGAPWGRGQERGGLPTNKCFLSILLITWGLESWHNDGRWVVWTFSLDTWPYKHLTKREIESLTACLFRAKSEIKHERYIDGTWLQDDLIILIINQPHFRFNPLCSLLCILKFVLMMVDDIIKQWMKNKDMWRPSHDDEGAKAHTLGFVNVSFCLIVVLFR